MIFGRLVGAGVEGLDAGTVDLLDKERNARGGLLSGVTSS